MISIEELEIDGDEIVAIEEYEIMDTIDIELDSKNRLFFANDILTHNSGWGSEDLKINDVSESAALIHTVDMLFGIITSPEMKARSEYYLKCLANRVAGYENMRKRFTMDWNYARIEEDKNAQIEDMDFVLNHVVGGHTQRRGPGASSGQSTIAAKIGSNIDPDKPTETINKLEIKGAGLF